MPWQRPLFLARQNYRLRRLTDAARLLPILGFLLFLMPLLWGPGSDPAEGTARDGVWLFLAWPGLILCALLLARGLAPVIESEREPEDDR